MRCFDVHLFSCVVPGTQWILSIWLTMFFSFFYKICFWWSPFFLFEPCYSDIHPVSFIPSPRIFYIYFLLHFLGEFLQFCLPILYWVIYLCYHMLISKRSFICLLNTQVLVSWSYLMNAISSFLLSVLISVVFFLFEVLFFCTICFLQSFSFSFLISPFYVKCFLLLGDARPFILPSNMNNIKYQWTALQA